MANFDAITAAFLDGILTVDQLREEKVDPADFAKIREDNPQTLRIAAGPEEARAQAKDDKREVDYIMSTENPVGFFRDAIKVQGWDLKDFKKRGMPFLFGHNGKELPLGRMSKVSKTTVDGQRVLAGTAAFTPEGTVERNDVVFAMVRDGFMPGGSVGFNVLEQRPPTEKERKEDKRFTEYSSVFTKAELVEFSSVPVGMDPDAVKMRSLEVCEGGIDAWFQDHIERGTFDPEVVAEVRRDFLNEEAAATRTQVQGIDIGQPEAEEEFVEETVTPDEPAAEERELPLEVAEAVADDRMELTEAVRGLTNHIEALQERIADLEAVIEETRSGDTGPSPEPSNDEGQPQKGLDHYLDAIS